MILTVRELSERCNLQNYTKGISLDKEIKGVYISDLLSRVMSNTDEGYVWITIQTHINTVAVASLNDLACIIIAESLVPEKNTIDKAIEENIPILGTSFSAYHIACCLCEMGIK